MGNAFLKDCAPSVPEIGPYNLVDDCTFPEPPSPIVTPIDPPIPIPPIDEGCYSLNVTGSFHGPDETGSGDGSLGVNVTYPTGDICEPEIDLQLFVPCFVKFAASGGEGTVSYDPAIETAEVGLFVVQDSSSRDACDFDLRLSLSMILPCPTDILGGDATVRYSADTETGEIVITPSAVPDTCDFGLNLDLTLPCPGTITAGVKPGTEDPCIARQPTIDVEVVNTLDSSSQATCSYDLQFDMRVPCPITWGDPDEHSVSVTKINTVGIPSGELLINSDYVFDSSSSNQCEHHDCFPKLRLNLAFPCPVPFEDMFGSREVSIYAVDELLVERPWAHEPSGEFSLTFHLNDVCDPRLQLSLNLPCPVEIEDDPEASVSAVDEEFWGGHTPTIGLARRWAYDQPTAGITISLNSTSDGVETQCLPSLKLNLNFPCPTGGIHSSPGADRDTQNLLDWRQAEYSARYGPGDAPYHPHYGQVPASTVQINRNMLDLIAQGGGVPDTISAIANSIGGKWGRTEFNENCQLDLDLSLYVPCGARSSELFLHHYSDRALGVNAPELPSYSVKVWQDWNDLNANDPCAYDEETHLFMMPGGGDGGILGQLLGFTPFADAVINGVVAKPIWVYTYRIVTIHAATLEVIPVLDDNQQVQYGFAINIREVTSVEFGDGVQPNSVDESGADYPSGFKVKPVGGGDGDSIQYTSCENHVLVRIYQTSDDVGVPFDYFEYENAVDGTCIGATQP